MEVLEAVLHVPAVVLLDLEEVLSVVGLDQVAGLAYVDVEGNLVVPEARDASLVVDSILGVAGRLSDHLEVHQGVQVGHVGALAQVDQVGHREIAFLVVYAGQDPVQEVLAVEDHQVHSDLWVVQVDH